MRLGVVSDAHGNLAGLDAALAAIGPVDALLFAGDLLGYYFEPRAVMDRLRERGASCVLGNHDAYFLAHLGDRPPEGVTVPSPAAYRARYGPSLERAAKELSASDVAWLRSLPAATTLTFDGARVLLTHGSPWRPVDEYVYPDHAAFPRFAGVDADLVVMGHTHRPFVRTEGSVVLLNPGSCGQPRDHDPRAACARVDVRGGRIETELLRATYDRAPLLARCAELAPDVPLLVDLLTRGDRAAADAAR